MFSWGVHDLNNQRNILGEPQNLRCVQLRRMTVPHGPSKNRRAS
jgi:hypothetical protein